MIAWRMSDRLRPNTWLARLSQVPIDVPPCATSSDTACFASARVCGEAARNSFAYGYTIVASARPAMTANSTPSRSVSTAVAVAAFAASIFVLGLSIEPEQSIMMT